MREPLVHEEHARFAAMPHIGPDVEEAVRGYRSREPFHRPTAPSRMKAVHGESHEADDGLSFEQFELKRHLPLQHFTFNFVMREQHPPPFADKRRFLFTGDEAFPGCVAERSREFCCGHIHVPAGRAGCRFKRGMPPSNKPLQVRRKSGAKPDE